MGKGKEPDPDQWKRDVQKYNVRASKPKKNGRISESATYAKSVPHVEETVIRNDDDRYVVRHSGGWAVKKASAKRASAVFRTQEEAIRRAKEIVEKSGRGNGEIRVQGRDGKLRDSISGSKNETTAKDNR